MYCNNSRNYLEIDMPDISMCWGKECPFKEDCYRYIARPNEYRQSYFTNPPYEEVEGRCQFFILASQEEKLNAR
jgi:hypothetical protein